MKAMMIMICFLLVPFIAQSKFGNLTDTNTILPLQKLEADSTVNKLLAEEIGFSITEIEASKYFQNAFYQYVEELEIRHPDEITAAWVEPIPNIKGHIRFRSKAPNIVIVELNERDLLGNKNIIVYEGGGHSRKINESRQALVVKMLEKNGYRNLETYFDVKTNKIIINLYTTDTAKYTNSGLVKKRLIEQIKENTTPPDNEIANLISSKDIKINIVRSDGPIMELQSIVRGGGIFNSAVPQCSGSFTLYNQGILTAGHCTSVYSYTNLSGGTVSVTPAVSVSDLSGDFGYFKHQDSGLAEYFTPSLSKVHFRASKSSMQGKSICLFAAYTNQASCNHTIEIIGVTVFAEHLGWNIGNLVKVTGRNSGKGDSGSPWHTGSTAYGIHTGVNTYSEHSYFSPVVDAEGFLGVRIKTVEIGR
ncbi:trypsin-like serine protease [Thalassomonas actiniarum]|uniref:Peptidase S1 domain-containing protein n=1 Tax=Thalassomonas actiniarum TaxID=485447 RepID=A0AAF0C4S2_9GAMM|nr:trypsin-like serine protease [Thalassomonas actiniarum]WDE00135.1 hypothetical protein SG35_005635 [Thalassomonas actiniarum]